MRARECPLWVESGRSSRPRRDLALPLNVVQRVIPFHSQLGPNCSRLKRKLVHEICGAYKGQGEADLGAL
jgi:hypothetical protein